MALYAIGDVQGCDEELGRLLKKLRFNADRDRVWFVGDLVNRGPDSLGVMRRVRAMADNTVVTLGNHDLHLIAVAFGASKLRRNDTLEALMNAADFDGLLTWLITCPFMHEDRDQGLALVHAGLPPQWDMETARLCAGEAHVALTRDPEKFVSRMYGDQPRVWDTGLAGADRSRYITNCFTRLRFLHADGSLNFTEKDGPKAVTQTGNEERLIPWFAFESARWRGTHVVFGHWSTLGYFRNEDVTSLDTGCGWGNQLTALRLDRGDAPAVAVDCSHYARE